MSAFGGEADIISSDRFKCLMDHPVKDVAEFSGKLFRDTRRAKHQSMKSRLSWCRCRMPACLSTSPELDAPEDKGRTRDRLYGYRQYRGGYTRAPDSSLFHAPPE
jgi:hypothetical protein